MRRYPYHRYLTYQVLNGESVDDIIENMEELEYIPPLQEDVEELRSILLRRRVTREVRERQEVLFFDEPSPSLDQVFWIVETPPARTSAERLLLDRVHPKHVATIMSLKFNDKLTQKAIEMFRDGFWDTSVLTPIDFAEYFRLAGDRKPDPPPDTVSLKTRPAYAQWKHGLHPDEEELTPETMVREIQVDAFMKFKELASNADIDAQKMAKTYAELVLKTTGAGKALAAGRGSRSDSIPAMTPKLAYADTKVPTIGELHTEYSEHMSGTGAVSESMGKREEPSEPQA